MTPPTATLATPTDLVAFDASDRVGLEPFPDDIDLSALTPADLPPGAYGDLDEIAEFEELVRKVKAGEISDDDFRPLRLHFGVYGIRQSTETHMVRVKTPLGRFNARQFDAMAVIAERYAPPRVGHITTRQCFQFHRIPLEQVADVLKVVAVAGLTTREACGNAIRNVTMSPLAGVHPSEELDVQAAADEIVRALLRHPAYQSLPRKFKIAFSATPDDDAGTGFHDVGVIPKHSPDGEPGYQVVLGGGLGSSAREAVALEPWTRPEHLLPTALAALDIFEEKGERRNRVRARMKFLVKKMGAEAFVAEVLERREAHIRNGVLSTVVPHPSVPEGEAVPIPTELPAELADRDLDAYLAWLDTNVVRQRQGDRFALWASLYLGDLTPEQFRAIARMMRETGVGDARLTIRQNVVFRDVTAEQLPQVWAVLSEHGLDRPFAEKSGDVVSCPGAETCNLAITASRGLGAAVQDQLRNDNLDAVKGVGINISGCPNSCGQHQAWDIGFSGMAKHDADGNEAPPTACGSAATTRTVAPVSRSTWSTCRPSTHRWPRHGCWSATPPSACRWTSRCTPGTNGSVARPRSRRSWTTCVTSRRSRRTAPSTPTGAPACRSRSSLARASAWRSAAGLATRIPQFGAGHPGQFWVGRSP
jgi:sulfite reductase (ferredoxin)